MSIDLKLDTSTHDLEISGGDFVLVEEDAEVAQHIKIRLLFWQSEWILDYTLGVPYIDGIYSTSKSQEFKDQVIKDAILGTQHVKEILDYSFGVDRASHGAQITFVATSAFGDIRSEIVT